MIKCLFQFLNMSFCVTGMEHMLTYQVQKIVNLRISRCADEKSIIEPLIPNLLKSLYSCLDSGLQCCIA